MVWSPSSASATSPPIGGPKRLTSRTRLVLCGGLAVRGSAALAGNDAGRRLAFLAGGRRS